MKGVKPKQAARFTVKYLDKFIDAATTETYNEWYSVKHLASHHAHIF